MNHISANYLPLVVRKQLGLYCLSSRTFRNKCPATRCACSR
ncbi:two-component sensor protein RcsC [Klebsiella pneumoniae]|uniref:Two-component sensor protein RcsC n=1 Tax=Klebsiella pneumoniae TaxID=573 RepID=A0A377VYE6_KLEPN|nr:two-component sensor protein RcsC [Klebsiella pneumoniae]